MISSLKARLQLLIGFNAGTLYFSLVFNGSLWLLKFHVTSKSSSSATVLATKQLKVMLLKAFAAILVGPDRVMLISKPAKGETFSDLNFQRMLRESVLREALFRLESD